MEVRDIVAQRKTNIVTPIRVGRNDTDEGPPCLVVIHGPLLARRFMLDRAEQTIGRADDSEIRVDDDAASRAHARIVVSGRRATLVDLESTNGTFVNEQPAGEIELRDGDLVQIGDTIFKFLAGGNVENKYHQEMYRMTTVDGLTQAYNRRYFMETFEREVQRARRYRRELCLAMIDLDRFKAVNDTWGHLAGDHVLRETARIIADGVRHEDVFGRYGGEEFALLLPEVGLAGSLQVCERLREQIERAALSFGRTEIKVTASFGLASTMSLGDEFAPIDLIERADGNLYVAKSQGRNRVVA
ncbi:MAG: GGDEF domain-containing protein [Thermoanaerobaculia bacterium]|jgi:diguanylate cyclase (GGDEF)-like protein